MAAAAGKAHEKKFCKFMRAQRTLSFNFTEPEDDTAQPETTAAAIDEPTTSARNISTSSKRHIAAAVFIDRPQQQITETPKAGTSEMHKTQPLITPPIGARVRMKNKVKCAEASNTADPQSQAQILVKIKRLRRKLQKDSANSSVASENEKERLSERKRKIDLLINRMESLNEDDTNRNIKRKKKNKTKTDNQPTYEFTTNRMPLFTEQHSR